MDRSTVYTLEIIRALDFLKQNQSTMVALSKLNLATIGSGPGLKGLVITPGTGLTVSMGAGEIYQQANLEATAVSLLTPDAHTIVKQGISLDPQIITGFVAPGTTGQSINYLIEVQYQDLDAGAITLPYYNAANPSQQFTGPGNSGTAQSVVREGIVAWKVKAGAAATTGSQLTPSPDSGWVGLSVVTIAFGATSIVTGNIAAYGLPPFIPTNLMTIPANTQNNPWTYCDTDSGTAAAYVINPLQPVTSLLAGQEFTFRAANSNSGPATIAISGLTAVPLVRTDGSALHAVDIAAGMDTKICIGAGGTTAELLFPSPFAWGGVDTGSAVGWWLGWVI